jgi:adenine/guanine phosphoribosyltransferase-like PRPP-binding protein
MVGTLSNLLARRTELPFVSVRKSEEFQYNQMQETQWRISPVL